MDPIGNPFSPGAGSPQAMIFSPSHGDIAFTVPLFDEFLRRVIPEFEPQVTI